MNKKTYTSLGRLTELTALRNDCLDYERELNDKIFQTLTTKYRYFFKKKHPGHGFYIRLLLTGFGDIAVYEEIAGNVDTDGIMSQVLGSVSKDPQVLIELGLGSLYAAFNKNKKDGNIEFAGGNLDETKTFASLYKMFDKALPGVKIKDTAPKNFESSVRYDMEIELPINLNIPELNKYKMYIENKTGVTNSAATSSFHYGTISSQAIAGGDLAYKTFLDVIQAICYDYMNGMSEAEGVNRLKEIKNQYFRQLIIAYIKWRLQNYFPVYTSSRKDGVVLCSEVLERMINGNYISLEDQKTIFPTSGIFKYTESSMYKSTDTTFKKGASGKGVFVDTELWLNDDTGATRSYTIRPEYRKSIENIKRDLTKISPKFKASLWYGKN